MLQQPGGGHAKLWSQEQHMSRRCPSAQVRKQETGSNVEQPGLESAVCQCWQWQLDLQHHNTRPYVPVPKEAGNWRLVKDTNLQVWVLRNAMLGYHSCWCRPGHLKLAKAVSSSARSSPHESNYKEWKKCQWVWASVHNVFQTTVLGIYNTYHFWFSIGLQHTWRKRIKKHWSLNLLSLVCQRAATSNANWIQADHLSWKLDKSEKLTMR